MFAHGLSIQTGARLENSTKARCWEKAPLAQLDRASGYEPEGREFESLRARHISNKSGHPVSDALAYCALIVRVLFRARHRDDLSLCCRGQVS